jgi:hypothetical protein
MDFNMTICLRLAPKLLRVNDRDIKPHQILLWTSVQQDEARRYTTRVDLFGYNY